MASAKAVPSSFIDGAGVAAFVFSLCSGAVYAVVEPIMIAFLPAYTFVLSVVIFILRFCLRKKVKTGVNILCYVAIGGGVFLAVLLNGLVKNPASLSLYETIAAAAVYFSVLAFGLTGVIYSLAKRKGKLAACGYYAAVFSRSFSFALALLTSGTYNIGSIISFSVAVVTIILCVIKRIRDEI